MKKTSKLFGAVALSAALAMGTAVPAFAAAGDAAVVGADGTFKSDKTAESVVSVYYNPDQLSATVPLNVTIVATNSNATATENIIAPNYDKYVITNTSATADIKVTNVKSAEVTETGAAASNWKLLDLTNPTAAATQIGAAKGALDLDLKAIETDANGEKASESAAVALESTASGDAFTNDGKDVTDTQWKAAKDGGKVNMEISGKSMLSAANVSMTASDMGQAVKITFTIDKDI